MLMGIRKMGFVLLFLFIEDRISVRRVRLLQWGDIKWHCLHYLKGGTGRGVKRHRGRTSCTKAPVPSVRHRPALYKVQHEGTVSAPEYRHLRTPPSSAPPATEPETSKRRWWKIFFLSNFCKYCEAIVIFVLCQMNSLNWLVIWLGVNPWLDFLLCTLMYQGIISI